jgi:RNA polymerase sigma-70 factor (ECF subfamily)
MKDKHSTHKFSIEKFRAGDKEEFEYIWTSFYDTIYIFAYGIIGDEPVAQDITTETFIKLWKLRENFEKFENIRAFLFITARNACFDFLRLKKRQKEKEKEIRLLLEAEEQPGNAEIEAEVLAGLNRQISLLPTQCNRVFTLLYFHNQTIAQVSVALKISKTNVRGQKAIAIKRLRSWLIKKATLS